MSDPLVIVESPYRGKHRARNVLYAQLALLDCITKGETPIAAHLMSTQVLNDRIKAERRRGLALAQALIPHCTLMAVYIDLGTSEGMEEAIDIAQGLGLKVESRAFGEDVLPIIRAMTAMGEVGCSTLEQIRRAGLHLKRATGSTMASTAPLPMKSSTKSDQP